ncbi:MAG: geranylgeranyl reductase family protein [Spirochaetaceae bacterium]
MYDAVIIGAGPAGSTAARELSDAGLRCVILEKENLPREKPCAGGVPIDTFSYLPEKAKTVIEGWVERVVFSLRGERWCEGTLPPKTMAMVRRSRFDSLLAENSGAEIRSGKKAVEIRNVREGVEAVTKDGKVYRGRYGILAAGALSPFNEFFDTRKRKKPSVALAADVEVATDIIKSHAGTAKFEFGGISGGYAWSFPKADRLSVGSGQLAGTIGEMAGRTRTALRRMNVPEAGTIRFRGHPIQMPDRKSAFCNGRFLRIGEAAGLVDPLIGEGIRHAVRSGCFAALAVRAGNPRQYERQCRREILRDLLTAVPFARLFYGFPELSFHLGVENPLFLREFVKIFSGKSSYRKLALRFPLYFLASPFFPFSSGKTP